MLVLSLFVNFVIAQNPAKPEDISPLLIGEKVPEATLTNQKGEKIDFQKLIKKKPSIIIFYRGGWCPYCNLQLAGIQEIEEDLLNLGYQIIAISPDSEKFLTKTTKKKKLSYTLLSDANLSLTKNFGLAFIAPQKYERKVGLKERSNNQNTEMLLPVPAVFLVDTDGKIQFEYINPDYSVRLSSKMLKAIAEIQKNIK